MVRASTSLLLLLCVFILGSISGFPVNDEDDTCLVEVASFKKLVTNCRNGLRDLTTQLHNIQENISETIKEESSQIKNSIKNAGDGMNSTGIVKVNEQKLEMRELSAEIRTIVAAAVDKMKVEQRRISREANEKFADAAQKLEALNQKNLETFSIVQKNHAILKLEKCPANDVKLSDLPNGKKYFISNYKRVNWTEAKDFCENNKMHLASPKTQQDLYYLYLKASALNYPHHNWWLSAIDIGKEPGHFKWHDGSQLARNSALWFVRNPDHFGIGKEACVQIYTNYRFARLIDNSCSDKSYFICEVPDYCL